MPQPQLCQTTCQTALGLVDELWSSLRAGRSEPQRARSLFMLEISVLWESGTS